MPKAFERAIEVNQLKLAALATDAEKSEMYGLFKQAKLGDATGERPGMLDFVGRAKWDSWSALKGTPREEAMASYTERSYAITGLSPGGAATPHTAAAGATEELALSHDELREMAQTFVAREINPHVDAWEAEGIFPAKELFKKMGDAGLLGLTKPVEYGGMGLPFR